MVTRLAEFSFQPLHNSPESAERHLWRKHLLLTGARARGELLVKQQFQTHPTFRAHLMSNISSVISTSKEKEAGTDGGVWC